MNIFINNSYTYFDNLRVSVDASVNALTVLIQDSFQKASRDEKVLQISTIAVTIFGCLTALYMNYRLYCYYSKRVKGCKPNPLLSTPKQNPPSYDIVDLESGIKRSEAILKYLMKQPDSLEKESIKKAEAEAICKYEKLIALKQGNKIEKKKDDSSPPDAPNDLSNPIQSSTPIASKPSSAGDKAGMANVLKAIKEKESLTSHVSPAPQTISAPSIPQGALPLNILSELKGARKFGKVNAAQKKTAPPTQPSTGFAAILSEMKKGPKLKPVDLTETKTASPTQPLTGGAAVLQQIITGTKLKPTDTKQTKTALPTQPLKGGAAVFNQIKTGTTLRNVNLAPPLDKTRVVVDNSKSQYRCLEKPLDVKSLLKNTGQLLILARQNKHRDDVLDSDSDSDYDSDWY